MLDKSKLDCFWRADKNLIFGVDKNLNFDYIIPEGLYENKTKKLMFNACVLLF